MQNTQNNKKEKWSQNGNITLMTTILVVSMLLLSGAVVGLTKSQYNLSQLHNNTSNNYYLAEAGMEIFVASMNELVSAANSQTTKELQEVMAQKIFIQDKESKRNILNEKYVRFDKEKGFFINKEWIILRHINKIYQVILDEYFEKEGIQPNNTYRAKPIIYSLKGEKASTDQETYIRIIPYINGAGIHLPSSLKDKEIIDYNYLKSVETLGAYTEEGIKKEYEKIILSKNKNRVKAMMGVSVSVYTKNEKNEEYSRESLVATIGFLDLEKMDYKILEKYEWLGRPIELLDSGITCFSDVLVEGELEVQGDLRVFGNVSVGGGSLDVRKGDSKEPQNQYTGNIYAVGEVNTVGDTYGESYIGVEGHVVAESVRATRLANEQIKRQRIGVRGNLFVQDDVGIEEEITDADILVDGVIVGISDTDLRHQEEKNPDKSSSIFNKGGDHTVIEMKGAYIAGQPFVDYKDGTGYHRLYESIGEPYRDLQHYPEYTQINGFTDKYILEENEMIRKDKIKIEEQQFIYAPAYVSAEVGGELVTQQYTQSVLENQNQALKVFYQGGEDISLSELTGSMKMQDYDYIVLNPEKYYGGENVFEGKVGMYHRDYGETPKGRYRGIEAYMTAMRSVFWGEFQQDEEGNSSPKELRLQDWIDYRKIEELEESIQTDSPIKIIDSDNMDISKWDQQESDKPGLIIAKGPIRIISSNPSKKRFKGIIIALDDMQIEGDVVIEGSLIVSGDLLIDSRTGRLQVLHDTKMLMQIPFKDKILERQVLDLLGIIHLKDTDIKKIFKADRHSNDSGIYYTRPLIRVKNEFDLVIQNAPLEIQITTLKSERK